MPFGIPFLYDEEELRRRALTPGINPNAPTLPDMPPMRPRIAAPPPLPNAPGRMPGMEAPSPLPEAAMGRPNMPLPTPGIPGGASMPPIKQPTRAEQYREAKDTYMLGTPSRKKSALLGAAGGAIRGLAQGGLGGAIGGALGGAIGGGVNPRGLREQEFNQRVRPEILEGWTMEDMDRDARAQAAKAAGDQAMQQVQLANIGDQIRSRQSGDRLAQEEAQRKAGLPQIYKPGDVGFDPRTQKKVFEVPMTEKPLTDADAEQRFFEETGDTIESLSQKSLAGRIEAIKGRLTPEEQRLAFGGATSSDDPRAVAAAQSKWAKTQEDELNSIRRDTSARVKSQYRGGGQGRQSTSGSGSKPIQRRGQPGRRAISVAEAAELLK